MSCPVFIDIRVMPILNPLSREGEIRLLHSQVLFNLVDSIRKNLSNLACEEILLLRDSVTTFFFVVTHKKSLPRLTPIF